ncbi:DHA2 family efflux MFS transporter permease subunit [Clostridium estertheticum]|uniref:DHA2 family efflux MFS transporter permease subunit n=1 Tax=Clostridium estertheticum TaxID=238834 RepID=UPI001C6E20A9|nr:DHA2 family efflux MFS transporter permease subunit [Clostridium estertheticum]MBW9173157.1 DHA2 family efflux MFS transporter permease subunit [Clostridium estertheticum]WLC77198.1 DHA2 family efflux MFS transporter permease subunit [Clostridium estertheticum]
MTNSNKHKWSILIIVTLVSFITNVDSTIVIIGLPKIMQGLNLTVGVGLWTITAYMISSTVLILPAGKWADTVGTKRIFILGLVVFTIGTVLCGIANSGLTLIIYRIIQGVGAALALATATPIILKTFPDNQLGLALGINATSWVVGALVGPVVGGALIGKFGWSSIFFITVPFALIGIIGAALVMKNEEANVKEKTDWIGIFTFTFGLVAMMVVLSEGASWGWMSNLTVVLFISTILLWIAFIITELHVENPLFNLSLLSYKKYTIGLGITVNYCIAYFSITLLLSIYLQGALHLSPMNAGLLIIPLSAPQLIMGPLGGKLADHFGTGRMIISSLIFLVIGLFMLGNLGSKLSIPAVVIPLIIISIANGIAWPSLAKMVLSTVPKNQAGSASGMFYTIYNVGRALSQALVILVIEFSVPPAIVSKAIVGIANFGNLHMKGDLIYSIDSAFHFFIIFFVIALILGLFLLHSKKNSN